MVTPEQNRQERIAVGVLYDQQWDTRPRSALDADFDLLRQIDPRIDILEVEYHESHELTTARGKVPFDESLRALAPTLTEAQKEALARVDIVVAHSLPLDVRNHAPRLKLVQSMGAGVSQLESAGLAEAGIRLTSAAGINAVGIAEFVVGRVLQHWKRFRELDDFQQQRTWTLGQGLGTELAGSTVGLIGFGAINSAVAQRLKAFDVQILATRRHFSPGDGALNVDTLYGSEDLLTMLPRCDVVIAAVPENARTIDIMDAPAFAAMKPGSFFCNVGRGSFVVEAALIDALTSGHLWAAAIDVTREEPLPPDNPLWSVPNLYLSPHVATSAHVFFGRLQALFRDNVERFLANRPLINEIELASPVV